MNTGIVVSYQSFGDLMRWNPHYYCIVLEGCIDETGSFHHIPIKDTSNLTEIFGGRDNTVCKKGPARSQFCIEDSFMEVLRVFGGQLHPDFHLKPESADKPQSVYH